MSVNGNFYKRNIEPTTRVDSNNGKTIIKYVTTVIDGKGGQDGQDGSSSMNITLDKTQGIFDSVNGHVMSTQSDSVGVSAYYGVTQYDTSVGTITGIPTGMTVDVSLNGEIGTVINIHVNESMTQGAGSLNIPVYINPSDPHDASGNKDEEYWDASVFDLLSVNLKYH